MTAGQTQTMLNRKPQAQNGIPLVIFEGRWALLWLFGTIILSWDVEWCSSCKDVGIVRQHSSDSAGHEGQTNNIQKQKSIMNIPIVFQSAWKLALFPSKWHGYPDRPRGSGLMSIKDFDTKAFRALSGASLGEFHGAALSAPKMLVLLLMAEILHQLR